MKKKIIRMLLLVILLILIATVITCFTFLRKEKEWLAFYIACCGGVLTVNLILSIILVNKNFGDKRRP